MPESTTDAHRRLSRVELAAVFAHGGVAEAYAERPPYPEAVFDTLETLLVAEPRVVLDLGAGEGALARPLAGRVDRVDAVDVSEAMIARGRTRPGGDRPNLRWLLGSAEEVELAGPYGLATAGASLHWMDLERVSERMLEVLDDGAFLAIVEHGHVDLAWQAGLQEVIVRHTRNLEFRSDESVVETLVRRELFEQVGELETATEVVRQPVEGYVEHFYSTASLAREHMSEAEAQAFSSAGRELVAPYATEGVLELSVRARVTWGRPLRRTRRG